MSRTTTVKGLRLAAGSILLVSFAQLAQKWGMANLPDWSQWPTLVAQPLDHAIALLFVAAGILAYLLSMLCWLGALVHLPLNRAYPLLGLSYGLVYVSGVVLPWYQEHFSWPGVAGVALIVLGVVLVNARRLAPDIRR